ncbi:MAG: uracil-DNA glycosylase [Candidatus Aenigmarchaeota archaeon]|nr:uracil-DNA glycosylase [Candidatus Aenigmarchaeota archaeon]
MKDKQQLMEELEEKIKVCKACSLWQNRTNAVPGEGNLNAKIMLIGLGPGYWEDQKGRPFVGKAGQLLNQLLESVGLKRENVYITNVVKCIPPNNRPTEEQIATCTSLYLKKQIEIISPKIIITLGEIATRWVFLRYGLKYTSMGKLHGKPIKVSNIFGVLTIIPMYHPASALYNPQLKDILFDDWKSVENVLKSV